VTAEDQEPVQGASVAITEGPEHPDLAALTNAQGHFSLGNLLPGNYRLAVNKAGYSRSTIPVRVLPGQTARVSVRLDR
jgi:hypothetical protein